MNDDADLNQDIDDLFAHLSENLDVDPDEEQDWMFSLSSPDLEVLNRVAEELGEEFDTNVQEEVEEVDVDGNVTAGDPMLAVMRRGALSADEVKAIAQQMLEVAEQNNLRFEGVDCYDPIDEEELFGWMELEDACWRLRSMTDCGLAENDDLPWAFLLSTPSLDATDRIVSALGTAGFSDHDRYDDPDEDGSFGLCAFLEGRNNEFELKETATKISDITESEGGSLIGIQFYTREDIEAVFGDEEE